MPCLKSLEVSLDLKWIKRKAIGLDTRFASEISTEFVILASWNWIRLHWAAIKRYVERASTSIRCAIASHNVSRCQTM